MDSLRDIDTGTKEVPTKTTVSGSSLSSSLPIGVQLSLTIVFTTLYSLLFLLIYLQLILILVYKHKRLSYQSVFLFLCLLWAVLRTTLFSFYFNDSSMANRLNLGLKWLLYAFPIVLQYFTLSLLALYFSQVSGEGEMANYPGWKMCLCLFLTCNQSVGNH